MSPCLSCAKRGIKVLHKDSEAVFAGLEFPRGQCSERPLPSLGLVGNPR